MDNKELIQRWINLFNEADAESIAELYHDDAVNHQVAVDPITGKDNIRQMFIHEFSQAEMTCIPENIFCDGDWVILEWKDPNELRGCGFFQIKDSKIKFQRGYWDMLTFLRAHKLPLPKE